MDPGQGDPRHRPVHRRLYYGTHPAVRIYYSPEVMDWLNSGRQGDVADGGMIIKEMFPPPAALYVDPVIGDPPPKDPTTGASPLDGLISAWTVMVKDRSVAKGGWFYANPDAPKIDTAGKTPRADREGHRGGDRAGRWTTTTTRSRSRPPASPWGPASAATPRPRAS